MLELELELKRLQHTRSLHVDTTPGAALAECDAIITAPVPIVRQTSSATIWPPRVSVGQYMVLRTSMAPPSSQSPMSTRWRITAVGSNGRELSVQSPGRGLFVSLTWSDRGVWLLHGREWVLA